MNDLRGQSLLIANRAEIARRIIRTARDQGIRTVAVHELDDAGLPYVAEADASVQITTDRSHSAYADSHAVLAAAQSSGATAIHPGYGFLSENAAFARLVRSAGLTWVGPEPETIELMGDKVASKALIRQHGIPVLPGSDDPITSLDEAMQVSANMPYPLMLKASAGGGGMGMTIIRTPDEFPAAFAQTQRRATSLFANPTMLIEKYVTRARHIEVQILGTATGRMVGLGERECSVQRRHQKLIEESPSPFVDDALRASIVAAAVLVGESVNYRGAGTVEFIVDADDGSFYFLEMNTRLQVEHPVTEVVTGVDLVLEQLLAAFGLPSSLDAGHVEASGHAIELRICAEDPVRFIPSPGHISAWSEPRREGVRIDAGYASGTDVSRRFDSLLAKVVVGAPDRATCRERALLALREFGIEGVRTNMPFLRRVLEDPAFVSGDYDTGLVGSIQAAPTSS